MFHGRFRRLAAIIVGSALPLLAAGNLCSASLVQYWPIEGDSPGTSLHNEVVAGSPATVIVSPSYTAPFYFTSTPPAISSTEGVTASLGANHYIDGGDINLQTTSVNGAATVSLWAQIYNANTDYRLFSPKNNPGGTYPLQGTVHGSTTSGDIEVYNGSGWASLGSGLLFNTGTYPPPSDSWHHLAFVWDKDQVTLYFDGTAQNTATARFDFSSIAGGIGFGARYGYGADPGNGGDIVFDDIAIFDTALSAGQVASLSVGTPPLALLPEPASLGLLAMGGLLLLRRKRA
jgi:hypothetical protein